jgi:hydrogenase-4 component B
MIAFMLGLGLILLGAMAAWGLERRPGTADRFFRWSAVGGCLLALVPAVFLLLGIAGEANGHVPSLACGLKGAFGIDLLSAWFLLIVLGVGATIVAYGVPYLGAERGHRSVRLAHLLLGVLIVALAGVVTARTILAFVVSWEVMAIAAWFLVIFEAEKPEVWRAGMVYLVLTHVCTLALIGMFAAWTGGHAGWRLDHVAGVASNGRGATSVILILGLVGFGIKAGAFPFHFWLPGAHAAAPSHVSALLSGIMLKVGIYGLCRMLALLGPPPAWWGWTVLLMGLASAVLGVLWALAQHDLKRLLAYHSVENIGIILLGLGLGALGTTYGHPAIALLGVTGALLHALNHALFKGLLFLSAGAVARHAGTREIDRLGGLARRMPRTALAFLVGSIAIVGLPPLNGFVSEWLIFRGLLGAGVASGQVRVAAIFAAGLALAGALALACFTKLYGVVFLGAPRHSSVAGQGPIESDLVPPQLFLATCCIVIGVAPALLIPAAVRTAGIIMPRFEGSADALGVVSGALPISAVWAALLGAIALGWAVRRTARSARAPRSSATWSCAYAATSSRMQYTASSYASSLLGIFGPVSGVRAVRTPASFHTHPIELVLDRLGHPLWSGVVAVAMRLRPLQSGSMRWYLLYAILCLLALLLYLRFAGLP